MKRKRRGLILATLDFADKQIKKYPGYFAFVLLKLGFTLLLVGLASLYLYLATSGLYFLIAGIAAATLGVFVIYFGIKDLRVGGKRN